MRTSKTIIKYKNEIFCVYVAEHLYGKTLAPTKQVLQKLIESRLRGTVSILNSQVYDLDSETVTRLKTLNFPHILE